MSHPDKPLCQRACPQFQNRGVPASAWVLLSGASLAEAEFLAGWISLRYLRDTKEPQKDEVLALLEVALPSHAVSAGASLASM